MPLGDECKCVGDLEKREIMAQFANSIAGEVADMLNGICPPMVDYVIEEVVARMVHIAVYAHDETIETNEARTAEAVQQYVFKISKKLPSIVVRIMEEANIEENPNARH